MSSPPTTRTRLPRTSLLPRPGSAEGCGDGAITDEYDRGRSTSEGVGRLPDGVPSHQAAYPLTLGEDGFQKHVGIHGDVDSPYQEWMRDRADVDRLRRLYAAISAYVEAQVPTCSDQITLAVTPVEVQERWQHCVQIADSF